MAEIKFQKWEFSFIISKLLGFEVHYKRLKYIRDMGVGSGQLKKFVIFQVHCKMVRKYFEKVMTVNWPKYKINITYKMS